jgi:hypothetical protein
MADKTGMPAISFQGRFPGASNNLLFVVVPAQAGIQRLQA